MGGTIGLGGEARQPPPVPMDSRPALLCAKTKIRQSSAVDPHRMSAGRSRLPLPTRWGCTRPPTILPCTIKPSSAFGVPMKGPDISNGGETTLRFYVDICRSRCPVSPCTPGRIGLILPGGGSVARSVGAELRKTGDGVIGDELAIC